MMNFILSTLIIFLDVNFRKDLPTMENHDYRIYLPFLKSL
jgi:hypothetical protein